MLEGDDDVQSERPGGEAAEDDAVNDAGAAVEGEASAVGVVVVKVSKHSSEDVEVKVYLNGDELFEREARVSLTLAVPRALGTMEKGALLNHVWLLNRLGFEQGLSLEQIVDNWAAWEAHLLDLLQRALDRARADESGVAWDVAVATYLGDFEQAVRNLGCAIKSASRDVAKMAAQSREAATTGVASLCTLREFVSSFKARVASSSAAFVDRTAVTVAETFDEFVAMAIHQAAAAIALRLMAGDGAGWREELAAAAAAAALQVQGYLVERGCKVICDTDEDIRDRENYLLRWHQLKHYFLSGLYMDVNLRAPSQLWVDAVGMTMAGLAMLTAVVIMWVAERRTGAYSIELAVALILGYVLKDRIKEWGKRHLVPMLKQPDRIAQLRLRGPSDQKVRVVGRVREWAKVKERKPSSHAEHSLARAAHEPGPENSFSYERRVQVDEPAWRAATERAFPWYDAGSRSLDGHGVEFVQVIRLNVGDLCKRIGRSADSYAFVSLHSGQPGLVECPQIYELRLTVEVALLKKGKAKSGAMSHFSAHRLTVDASGLRNVSTRDEGDGQENGATAAGTVEPA